MIELQALRNTYILFILLILFSINSCAPFISPPGPPISDEQIQILLSHLKEQQSAVNSFYWSGEMTLNRWPWKEHLFIFVVAKRVPLQIRIEISHSTGQALYHILIKGSNCQVISFKDRAIYEGRLDNVQLIRSIFSGPVPDINTVWSVMRGYPVFENIKNLIPVSKRQIRIIKTSGKGILMHFAGTISMPKGYKIKGDRTEICFNNIRCQNGICISKSIELRDSENGNRLRITINNPAFNKEIPEDIFRITIPPDFQLKTRNKPGK